MYTLFYYASTTGSTVMRALAWEVRKSGPLYAKLLTFRYSSPTIPRLYVISIEDSSAPRIH